MRFEQPLLEGRLIRRYKRFLADVRLADGSEVIAHCPNTGSMLGCQPNNARVWLSHSDNPKRKLAYTWELVETRPGVLACVNTARPNRQAQAAICANRIEQLAGYAHCRQEVNYGRENSRIDLLLSGHDSKPDAWVEVKNVTLEQDANGVANGQGFFPDAVTVRGQKHLRELMAQVDQGDRGVLLFVVNHSGIETVRPADFIDPQYGRLLRQAAELGVEVLAWRAELVDRNGEPTGSLALTESVPVVLAL